ncbi:hypothetical protein AK830_g6840 [Neonectria ditissima]|uniref:Uncharacterized protein n=1 Tax=Neonectria ditissima TaxID=78410 RepID=A0A0P7APH6_9HYPO|nr:hypothetical protein AK830_g6840 [Neonectria ditissima]
MPFKSTELLLYFCKAEDPSGLGHTQRRKDCLSLAAQNPDGLRNSLLIAGIHYSFNVGHMEGFEMTFLHHKVEALRLVNKWLQTPESQVATACVKEISTLAFSECCLGDVATAETHLDGLMRFMDLYKPLNSKPQPHIDIEGELADRYFILTYNFVHGLKARLKDIIDSIKLPENRKEPNPSEVQFLMHKWHKDEVNGLETRLKAMRLFPAFFTTPPPGTVFQDIDAFPMIHCSRQLTDLAGPRLRGDCDAGDSLNQLWLDGAATRLLREFVTSHVQSIFGDGEKLPKQARLGRMMASWSGASSALGLYLQAVLGIWNAGQPVETRLLRRVLFILKQDLDRSDYVLESGDTISSDFWFWRAFVGAFSLAKHRCTKESGLRTLQLMFEDFIRRWIQKMDTTQWGEARRRLELIAFPPTVLGEDLGEQIWDRAVSKSRRP